MKKYIRFICLILLCFLSISPISGDVTFASTNKIPAKVRVVLPTYIYIANSITSEIYKKDGKDLLIDVNTVLIVDTTYEDGTFYKVCIEKIIDEKTSNDDYGYVLIAHVMDADKKSPEKKLDSNAKIKNDNTITYLKNEKTSEYNDTIVTLNKGTKVRILDGYDKKKEFTYISFYDNENNIVSYYVKTKDLDVKGVNYSLIVGISSLAACVSVILILLGVKGKKKKNKVKSH